MIKKIVNIYENELEHEHRFLISLVLAELIVISLFKFLPFYQAVESNSNHFESEEIFVENVIATRQSSAPATPPRPQVPVPVPNDEIIDDDIDFPEFDDTIFDSNLDPQDGLGVSEGEPNIVGNPQKPPSIVKIVEPTISDKAKANNIKAQIIVTFLVGTTGEVEDLYVSEIRLYEGEGDSYKVVNDIGYGILKSTLEAASKWRFIPATDQGEKVKTYIENSFNIGF